MNEPFRRTKDICVDFDGVLHSYITPWTGPHVVSDPPVEGAMRWLVLMELNVDYQVHIYSSRSNHLMGIKAMREWLEKYINEAKIGNYAEERTLKNIVFASEKPSAYLTIDDRAICFNGIFPTFQELDDFEPWYNKYEKVSK